MGFLKATPTGRTDDSHPSACTFTNMTVQTDEGMSTVSPEVPEKLKQTIGSHFPHVYLKPEVPMHPHSDRGTNCCHEVATDGGADST